MTEVAICNQALSAIGTRSTITSLAEDSNEARYCTLLYEPTRDECLEMAWWNFARKTATLTLLKQAPGTPGFVGTVTPTWNSNYPAPPWLYEYAYPSDCLGVRFLQPQMSSGYTGDIPIFGDAVTAGPTWNNAAVPFIVATDTTAVPADINVILTSQYQALAVYSKKITNVDLFSSLFRRALISALAGKLAIPLTGDKGLANGLISMANATIMEARVSDGNEGLTIQDTVPEWIAARSGGGGGFPYWFVAPYPALFTTF